MKNINSFGMMVALNISIWTARKKDKGAEGIVAYHYKATSPGNFSKNLMKSTSLDEINNIASSARTAHNRMTQPWDDAGYRYLSMTRYFDYTEEMSRHKQAFESAVSRFLVTYQTGIDDARNRLGDMFKETDYPTLNEITKKFSIGVSMLPIPTTVHNEMIDDITVTMIQEKVDREIADKYDTAQRSIWQGLYVVLSAMDTKLSDPNAIFRDSLVENIITTAKASQGLDEFLNNNLMMFLEDVIFFAEGLELKLLRKDKGYRLAMLYKLREFMEQAADNG